VYENICLLEVGMETCICQSIPEQKKNISLKQCMKHSTEPSNRFQNMYVHIKGNLTTSCLIISSLSLNLSCRQLIRCVSSDLDSHFLDFSSNSLSLCQRKNADQKKISSDQVQEIPGLYSALNSKPERQGRSQASLIKQHFLKMAICT